MDSEMDVAMISTARKNCYFCAYQKEITSTFMMENKGGKNLGIDNVELLK